MTAGRLELKYCVPEPVAAYVLEIARAHLIPEPLAAGPRQRITSLYLDTPDLQFLRWQRERVPDRFKLRIRRYGELPADVLYSEVKRKTRAVVRKDRVAFPCAQLPDVIARCRLTSGAEPRVLVTGMREALRDPGGTDAVTVDRDLRYQATRNGDLDGSAAAWRPLPLPPSTSSSAVLLELKHGFHIPTWMLPLMETLAPARVSFSKYATAMQEHVPERTATPLLVASVPAV